ncbi:hypothetical protein Tco_1520225 [Tanacetum coccineum]
MSINKRKKTNTHVLGQCLLHTLMKADGRSLARSNTNNIGVDTNNGIYLVAYAMVEAKKQKGLIQAITSVFPSVEHKYYVRHIHENMKSRFKGGVCKDMLWNAARATTVVEFNKKIGRAKCDILLNNICEVFSRQLIDGRDQPIVTCLEYIREYLTKRIVVVKKVIAKTIGPLTPYVTTLFNGIKKATNYIVQ